MKSKAINQKAITLFVFIVLVSILIFQGPFAYGQEWSAAQKEIWSMQKKAWELWKKGEMNQYKDLFHKYCIILLIICLYPLFIASAQSKNTTTDKLSGAMGILGAMGGYLFGISRSEGFRRVLYEKGGAQNSSRDE